MAYIGQEPGQGQAERYLFTATGSGTAITVDDSGISTAYTVNQVSVYLNGVKQVIGTGKDVVATDGSTITFASAYASGDVIEIIALSSFSPADTVPKSGGTFTGAVTLTTPNLGTVATGNLSNVAIVYPVGHIVQVQYVGSVVSSTGTTTIPVDDTIPQKTEGDEIFTLAITPKSATNKLMFDVRVFAANSVQYAWLNTALFQDSIANAIASGTTLMGAQTNGAGNVSLAHQQTSGTTSSITFKVRIGSNGGTTRLNGHGHSSVGRLFGGTQTSSLTIYEIQQ